MLDNDSKAIKWILDAGWKISDNYAPKLFERVFYCNEQLIGVVFEGEVWTYQEYFNMSELTSRVSKDLKDYKIKVQRLELIENVYNFFGNNSSPVDKDDWEAIETPNAIIHPSNPSHVAIDILINRVDVEADDPMAQSPVLWMIQNKDYMESGNKIDVATIIDKIVNEIKKRPKYRKYNYTLIIAGATTNDSDAQQKKSQNFDNKYDVVLLTGKRMRNHLLPVFRYRALYARHLRCFQY